MEACCERYEEATVTRGYVLELCVEMVIAMVILRWQVPNL